MNERISYEYYSTIPPMASSFDDQEFAITAKTDMTYDIFPLELIDSECCSCPRNFVKAFQILK